MTRRSALLAALLPAVLAAQAAKFYTYVGRLDHDSVLLAWGTATGVGNTIGRESQSHGKATVTVGEKREETEKNWVEVKGLKPDTVYPYEVRVGARTVGKGQVRTWPEEAQRLTFMVIGDYGNGSRGQRLLAEAMTKEFQKRQNSADPVRFVITTGDNIYGQFRVFGLRNTGDDDGDWKSKFFEPYEKIIESVPFYATLGNHDGNQSEARGDLREYLDNFFFPGGDKSRYYKFTYGKFAEFFALDSSDNTAEGRSEPIYMPDSEQSGWLKREMGDRGKLAWRIAYFHHPPFTAGPRHPPSRETLGHWMEQFKRGGVQAVFTGHEHNLQFSEVNAKTEGILYVVTGSGGELRSGNVLRDMEAANIAAWSPQRQFLVVEADATAMRITPVSYEPLRVVNGKGQPVKMPVVLTRK
ncbi:MAG: metallophosphoesterase family protein [Bryobacteraceae bacterium]|nr:metallophosphoesterase family protein [Bryobacteraceae bacterium]